jgi:hypothetical protein
MKAIPGLYNITGGNLPAYFLVGGIDSAFVFDGKTYLRKGKEYIRYPDSGYQHVHSLYPQSFSTRWRKWNHFLLHDLDIIQRFARLNEQYGNSDYSLTGYIQGGHAYNKVPYETLSEIFGWNPEEIKWLNRHNVFLNRARQAQSGVEVQYGNQFEVNFSLEEVLRMYDIFEVADKAGAAPSDVYEQVWKKRFIDLPLRADMHDRYDLTKEIADAVYRYLGANNSPKDWKNLEAQLHNEVNEMKRDALLPYLISKLDDIEDARALFNHLLLDAEMGGQAETSPIVEATSAVQLYFHRYFVDLEKPSKANIDKDKVKNWWKWMRNYRVWEANRKVFLYPENYIRPELRDTKTPQFQELENALLQGELSPAYVESCFMGYLDGFAAVGNLKITGANVYKDGKDDVLILFGHTRTEPSQYYYRTAKFTTKVADMAQWEPWKKVEASIDAARVFPVHAFGRLMVFWIEIQAREETSGRLKISKDGDTADVSNSKKKISYWAKIKFSYLNYNQQWTPAQEIKKDIELTYEIDDAFVEGDKTYLFAGRYCLITSEDNPGGDIQTIAQAVQGIPSGFEEGIDAVALFNNKKYFFKGSRCYIEGKDAPISFSRLFHFDDDKEYQLFKFEGKSFIHFNVSGFIINIFLRGDQSTDIDTSFLEDCNLIPSQGVSAAFEIDEGTLCLLDKDGTPFFFNATADDKLEPIDDSKRMMAIVNDFFFKQLKKPGPFLQADAIFSKVDKKTQKKVIFILRDGEYECYENSGEFLIPYEGYPKPIKGNLDFNMDKFFNKLHVVGGGGDTLHISYREPTGKNVVQGKLDAAFEYETLDYVNNTGIPSILDFYKNHIAKQRDLAILPSDTVAAEVFATFEDELSYLYTNEKKFNMYELLSALWSEFDNPNANLEEPYEGFSQAYDLLIKRINNFTALDSDKFKKIIEFAKELHRHAERLQEVVSRLKNNLSSNTDDAIIELRTAFVDLGSENEALKANEQVLIDEGLVEITKSGLSELRKLVKSTNSEGKEILTILHGNFGENWNLHLSMKYFVQAIKKNLENWVAEVDIDKLSLNDETNTFIKVATTDGSSTETELETETELLEKEFREKSLVGSAPTLVEVDDQNQKSKVFFEQLEVLLNESIAFDSGKLKKLYDSTQGLYASVDLRQVAIRNFNTEKEDVLNSMRAIVNQFNEINYGSFDTFPDTFRIKTKTNFTFGEPDWHIFEAEKGTFLCRYLDLESPAKNEDTYTYQLIRLTTTMNAEFSKRLFSGGMDNLLSRDTQVNPEKPLLLPSGATEEGITYDETFIKPFTYDAKGYMHTDLDFDGASGTYFWEIFFHAPYLIAQTLNTQQKFEEAKTWYEFIFDPAGKNGVWKFLPFMNAEDTEEKLLSQAEVRGQLNRYLDDPFDPHAIASLRPSAYRKAVVMSYIDNLLDWGDMLFRQYSVEGINEARMLYILAYDLLGDKPENMGTMHLSLDQTYRGLQDASPAPDFLMLENKMARKTGDQQRLKAGNEDGKKEQNTSVLSPYFFIPENELFLNYWNRVEDRLYKIRQSLNIEGKKQALPLFQPPIDPMELVKAVAGGASISEVVAGLDVAVPPYRFKFMLGKARELSQKLNQLGGELLTALEKKDAEALSLLQIRHEDAIFEINHMIREAQRQESATNLASLQAGLQNARDRIQHYQMLVDKGMSDAEIAQIVMMGLGGGLQAAAGILKLVAMGFGAGPDFLAGPFIIGTKYGGSNVGASVNSAAEAIQTGGESASMIGEAIGIGAQYERMAEDWDIQLKMAQSDERQINAQIEGARLQMAIARYEMELVEKELENNRSMRLFLTEKFSSEERYRWMSSQLSSLYFQTYRLAHEMAKYAEKSYQFERAAPRQQVSFIQSSYWNSQQKGLLAGQQLELDLDRMEQHYIQSDDRRLEVSKNVSLLELDPLAFVDFKSTGQCEFSLTESLFDYDFPGHYCRQIKTISVSFDAGEGNTLNAMLTQLSHKTIMEPDAKAVKFLLNPQDKAPASIRSNWKANQQIALSHFDEYEKNNGMFELRFDTELYLPFEGTGAVSNWKLEIKGKNGMMQLHELVDLVINVKYTAVPGGQDFSDAVKGMLKPYATVRYLDLNYDFHNEWIDFLTNDSEVFTVNLSRDHFQHMSSSKISGIYSKFELSEPGQMKFILNGDEALTLNDGKYLETPGLSISSRGSQWSLQIKGDKTLLKTVHLILGYKASVQ